MEISGEGFHLYRMMESFFTNDEKVGKVCKVIFFNLNIHSKEYLQYRLFLNCFSFLPNKV